MQLRATRLTAIASAVKRAFNIRSLFAGSVPGVWYDPSDYTTLFQDSAGTTPVTAVEQPVGLMLDKSQELVLGPQLVTNGDFSNGTTGWTAGSGGAISADTTIFASGIKVTGGGAETTAGAQQVLSGFVVGKSYRISTSAYAAPGNSTPNSATISLKAAPLATDSSSSAQVSASGVIQTLSFVFVATATSHTLYGFVLNRGIAWANTSSFAYFDNISVRELPGNHAFQATSASRPVLSARYNLLTKTEQFQDAAWSRIGTAPTVTANAAVAPDDTTTADRLAFSVSGIGNRLAQALATSTGAISIQLSVYLRGEVGGETMLVSDGWTISNDFTLTTEWQRFTFTTTGNASSTSFLLYAKTGTPTVYAWGASIVQTAQAPAAYQRVNTATDYATAGFLPYLKFDGVDDSLSTNSISFTATDKMSVFAGVRKLVDQSNAILVELSASVGVANPGSFNIHAPISTGANYASYLVGTGATPSTNTLVTTYTAPITNVVTVQQDIAASGAAAEIRFRINAVSNTGTSFGDAGTGNFGNYPLYIGRRGGSSLPFNGQMYSMIIVGKAVTAGELSSTEKFVASKTGVTL